MKQLIAALCASALFAGPALACGMNKSASHKMPTTASADQVKSDEAMSTFDPVKKPAFEEEAPEVTKPVEAEGEKTE